jgi:hypothetical protein
VWHGQNLDFAGQLVCRFGREAICLARDGPEPFYRFCLVMTVHYVCMTN